ncbi:MAG: RDD family protein [Sulfurospirillum sp.]
MRWRDAKKGKFKHKTEIKKETLHISPIINRIKAFLTDAFMIFMPIIYVVFYVVMGSREEFRANMLMGWLCILIPHFIITTLFLYIKNQTPGYKAYNIKLSTFKHTKPTFVQISVRYIVFTITIFAFPLLFIPFFTKQKLGLPDYISATVPLYSK